MPDDVSESFIYGTCHRATIGRRKAEDLGEALKGSAHDIEQLWIAM
jgi:hypothetical protein